MNYEIEKGVKIPQARKKNVWADTLRGLKVGDSFLVPTKKLETYTRPSIYMSAKHVGIRVTIRLVEDGMRVWRVVNVKN